MLYEHKVMKSEKRAEVYESLEEHSTFTILKFISQQTAKSELDKALIRIH